MTDGPYLETKEHLGGFWIIDVPDLDAALQWAAEGSKACGGKVEVRPFAGASPRPESGPRVLSPPHRRSSGSSGRSTAG